MMSRHSSNYSLQFSHPQSRIHIAQKKDVDCLRSKQSMNSIVWNARGEILTNCFQSCKFIGCISCLVNCPRRTSQMAGETNQPKLCLCLVFQEQYAGNSKTKVFWHNFGDKVEGVPKFLGNILTEISSDDVTHN